MTTKGKLNRWAVRTIFSGESSGGFISIELDDFVNISLPSWGRDKIMGFSIGLDNQFNNDLFLTGNFWSGGMFEYNITKDSIEAHN